MELPRSMRIALKGFRVIENGKLSPPVHALRTINTDFLVFPYSSEDNIRRKEASLEILRLIELMVRPSSEQTFKARLNRFNSYLKAAHCLTTLEIQSCGTDKLITSFDNERSMCSLIDSHGAEVLITDIFDCFNTASPKHVFTCVPRSQIARCASELWEREHLNSGGRFTSLYYVPTRKELRQYLGLDEPRITKLCSEEGFGWLPSASRAPVPKAISRLKKVA
jgi:hypothetical protein